MRQYIVFIEHIQTRELEMVRVSANSAAAAIQIVSDTYKHWMVYEIEALNN